MRMAAHRAPMRAVRGIAYASSTTPAYKRCDAFIERREVQGDGEGVLEGKTVAIKDIFDIKGMKTGFGHPTYRELARPAESNSDVVQAMLDSGGRIVGKTHMDELAWSLFGENWHYGTPRNPAAESKIPGGSSSGSATAVADGTVDIGIGSDTGGSIRVPASWCGIHGIRPTHGRVSIQGACALAPSFDTVGWFARDPALLGTVGSVLLPERSKRRLESPSWMVASDAFDIADESARALMYDVVSKFKPQIAEVLGSDPREVALDASGSHFAEWVDVFRVLQPHEIWTGSVGEWVREYRPSFGPGIKERFAHCETLQEQEVERAQKSRAEVRSRLLSVVGTGGIVMLPSTPGPPPPCNLSEGVDEIRAGCLKLSCIAGLSGLPQVSIPIGTIGSEGPVGLSLIGPPGCDEELMEMSERISAVISPKPL